MSSDLYSSHFTMLRATVLLCLVTSAVLTQSLPTAQYNGPTDDTIVDYHTDSHGSINDTLSAVPNCTADYTKMSIANRKVFQNATVSPFAVCVRADGCFVATTLQPNQPFVYMYDRCGWIKEKIMLPNQTGAGSGCAFTSTKLY